MEARCLGSMKKRILTILWVLYGLALVYLLFLRRLGADYGVSYWEWLTQSCNLIPGREIYAYLTAPYRSPAVLSRMLRNYAGNFLLFVPWGLLFSWSRISWKRFVLWTGITVLAVELVQLFAMLGCFDLDDMILNMGGALLAFHTAGRLQMAQARRHP